MGGFFITEYIQFLSYKKKKKKKLKKHLHKKTLKITPLPPPPSLLSPSPYLRLQILPINHLIIPFNMISIMIQQSVGESMPPALIKVSFVLFFSLLGLGESLFGEHSVPFETILRGRGGGGLIVRNKQTNKQRKKERKKKKKKKKPQC